MSKNKLEKALALLDKQGKLKPGRTKLNWIPTGLIRFDASMGGGLCRGRMYEVAGAEAAGKTTFALECVKAVQRRGLVAVYLDYEHALDPGYAKSIGVDCSDDAWIFDQPENLEDGHDVGLELIRSGEVGIVVTDSIAAMAPKKELEGERSPAMQARAFGIALRKYIGLLSTTQTIGLFVNQTRASFAKFGSPETTPGGRALKFFSSIRLNITKRKSKIYDDGIRSKIKIRKIKLPGGEFGGTSEYEIRYGLGIIKDEEILDIAEDKKLIRERGGIFKIGNRTIKSRDEILKLLSDERLREKVISHGT